MTPERADMIRATWLAHQDYIMHELSPKQPILRVPLPPPSICPSGSSGPLDTIGNDVLLFRLEPGSYSSNSAHRITCEGVVLERGIAKKAG